MLVIMILLVVIVVLYSLGVTIMISYCRFNSIIVYDYHMDSRIVPIFLVTNFVVNKNHKKT